jgi:hypothetical protein
MVAMPYFLLFEMVGPLVELTGYLVTVAGVLESFGFRQLLTVWRAGAFIDVFRRNKGWGEMVRKGFARSIAPCRVRGGLRVWPGSRFKPNGPP